MKETSKFTFDELRVLRGCDCGTMELKQMRNADSLERAWSDASEITNHKPKHHLCFMCVHLWLKTGFPKTSYRVANLQAYSADRWRDPLSAPGPTGRRPT